MKLSVCFITYNHEPFVRQALDGVLAQRVDFPWEVVGGEDCSTDRTGEIVREYAARRPDLIRVLDTPHNLGGYGKPNFVRTFAACAGEYVALLEGDDYWTDPEKLARQVAFLDANPTFAGCATVVREEIGGRLDVTYPADCPATVTLADLLHTNPFHTCSVVYRRRAIDLPDWFFQLKISDWPLHVLHARHGPFGMIPEVTAVYRRHPGGVWSHGTPVLDRWRTIDAMFGHLQAELPEAAGAVRAARANSSYLLAHYAAKAGDWPTVRAAVRTWLATAPITPAWLVHLSGTVAKTWCGPVYRAVADAVWHEGGGRA